MAKFKFHLETADGQGEMVLDYDNSTSELRYSNGEFVVEQSEFKDWQPHARMDSGKRNLKKIKIQLGLKCNYSCEYCSQRFVPRNPGDSFQQEDVELNNDTEINLSLIHI